MNLPHLITINAGCCHHEGDWNWKGVRSPFSRLYYVTEGSAKVRLEDRILELSTGHMYFIPAHVIHDCICDGPFVHYYIHLMEDGINGHTLMEEYDLPFEIDADSTDLSLFCRLCEINPFLKIPESDPKSYDNHQMLVTNFRLLEQRPICDILESQGIVLKLLSGFMRNASKKFSVNDIRINQVISYIRNNLSKGLDISRLASDCCLSKGHFFRMFKEETGLTPTSYINNKIMERSEMLLVTTDMPIKNIAVELGYNDYSYFIREFKKFAGVPPQQFREQGCK